MHRLGLGVRSVLLLVAVAVSLLLLPLMLPPLPPPPPCLLAVPVAIMAVLVFFVLFSDQITGEVSVSYFPLYE